MKLIGILRLRNRRSIYCILISFFVLFIAGAGHARAQEDHPGLIRGTVKGPGGEAIDGANIYLKGTTVGVYSDATGKFFLRVPAGEHVLCAQLLGYETIERPLVIKRHETRNVHFKLETDNYQLEEVVVLANGVTRVKKSAYNAVAIDTKRLQNSTLDLANALVKVPGIKLRESGGVGSDMRFVMDGFSGKHIKIFIDGVPQEGVGTSFGLNNIPVNFAERIEVYKGVVPVGFGTDALAGVINVVTNKAKRSWFLDASYGYGSFNTHKSYLNFGQTLGNGFTYEFNAFQNYSDNSYAIDVPVEEFHADGSTSLNTKKLEHVKRFHDNYHNEAVVGKVGVVGKQWADRLMFGVTYSRFYQEIQTGVVQKVVFGEKHRKGYSVMPSVEYRKQNLFTKGLDVSLTANYNRNITHNIDTASYKFNWRGEKMKLKSPGEQSYMETRSENTNWNGTATANYHFGTMHHVTLNHVSTSFERKNRGAASASGAAMSNAIPKETRKNISGLSYRLSPSEAWNLSVFGKYYNQYNAGPLATSSTADNYIRATNSVSSFGYGAAGTYFILKSLQAKLSFERAYRLPANEEVFGDEDMERGEITLRPEKSDNYNLSINYNRQFGKHAVLLEGGVIFRNTTDYIQRRITNQGWGKTYAAYENHGRVQTKGFNASVNYSYSNWVSVGANVTKTDVRDKVKTVEGGSNQENLTYGARMPNVPYVYANADLTLFVHNLWKKGNTLTFTYDNMYVRRFPLYSERLGSDSEYIVPTQFAHNLSLAYSLKNGQYNFAVECRNAGDAKLYDNYSLQKAGRAFYAKVRVYFAGR